MLVVERDRVRRTDEGRALFIPGDCRRTRECERVIRAPASCRRSLDYDTVSLMRRPACLFVVLAALAVSLCAQAPVTTHPRLWFRADDLPRLRLWAVASNPVFRDGLAPLAARAKEEMDAGTVPRADLGGSGYDDYPTEMYAELFAFMSLISSDEMTRTDYASRARTLLMFVMNEAAKGVAAAPFRSEDFAVNDRSRWHGEAFALTVDWIYPSLSAADKQTIRQVFLRWADEMVRGGYHHPEPVAVVNDPVLLADPIAVRWSGNNYFTAHMRNLGQRAIVFDAADDPDGALGAYLRNAIGAWLYMNDALRRGDSAGGLGPEGFEYYPQAFGYAAQFLLSLQVAGQNDASRWGPHVRFTNTTFWDDAIPAYLHSISPLPTQYPNSDVIYLPAWYGSGQDYWAADPIGLFGPLAFADPSRLEAVRWIETNVPPGGAENMLNDRVRRAGEFRDAIMYFLLFDPAAPAPRDPRPALPLIHFAPGFGRLLARTSWLAEARWFVYNLGWISIDHQTFDGNNVEFYRKGEWLMKHRVGYDLDYASSDNFNTLALENDRPNREPTHFISMLWQRGSQWIAPAGDPRILAQSSGSAFVYVLGDATANYNSLYENVTDITHASRSAFWMQPDHIVIFDRASSKTPGRFKRFWLNLPSMPAISGHSARMTTASGQQLFVTSLLPQDAVLTAETAPDEASGTPANLEFIKYRLRVEAPGGPQSVRFLHVLQGADAGASASPVTRLDSGAFTGVLVKNVAVFFPNDLSAPISGFVLTVPSSTLTIRVTGLTPEGNYAVTKRTIGTNEEVTVTAGNVLRADSGGVLTINLRNARRRAAGR